MYVSLSEIQIKEEEDAMNRPFTKVTCCTSFFFEWIKDVSLLGRLSNPRQQRQRRHQKMAVHVRYKSLYISQPSSAQQQRERMTKFCVSWRTQTAAANFSYFSLHILLEQVLRPTGALDRSWQMRNSKVKYKLIFTRRCLRDRHCHCLSSLLVSQ